MEKLSMCRICLAQDVRMHTIINTHLEDMYEKLSDKSFMTEDIRPVQACYICCARLQNCYLLKMNCLHSEELFTQMISSNMSPETMLLQTPVTKSLSVTPVTHLTTGVTVKMSTQCGIKTEHLEAMDEIKVKMERSEDDLETSKETDLELDDNIKLKENTNDNLLSFIKLEPAEVVADSTELVGAELEYLEEISSSQHQLIDNNINTTINNQRQQLKSKRDHKLKENCQQCDICKKKFDVFHFAKHNCLKIKVTCDICDKEFSSNNGLAAHKLIHDGTKPYSCTICNKCFTNKSTLWKHMLVHTDNKPFKCGTCNKGFKRKHHLTTHILVHTNEKPYQCCVCKKCFSQKGHLFRHSKVHEGIIKPYTCDICKNCFSDRSCMIRHMRRRHNL